MPTDQYVYIHTQTWALGYWNPAEKLNGNMKLFIQYELLWWFQIFNIVLTRHSPLGGMSDLVSVRKQGGAQGACPAVTFTENVPCEVCPTRENCRWRNGKEKKWIYQAPSKYPLRKESLIPLTQVKYMMIRENLLKFSFATGDTWRELYLAAKEELGSHHLYQEIIRIHSRTWNFMSWLWDSCPFLLDVKT